MTRHRWAALAGSVAVAACVISAGATALAAAQGSPGTARTHTNYQGPARTAHPAAIGHRTNYRGPARTGTQVAVVHGSNVQKAQRPQTQRQHITRGSK